MTNFTSSSLRQWITRGRLLVGLPTALGVLISVFFLLLALRPAWQDFHESKRRRDSLQRLQHNLPALEQQLEKARVALEEAEQQQELLVGLLAGRDKIQTFLALLNQQALLSDVEIQRYEPIQEPMPSSESQQRTSRSTSEIEEGSSEPTEPLLVLGYQKTSVALEVSGPYNGLQEFLQRMEGLEVLVASSDLEIAAAVQDNDEEGTTPPIESRTRLTVQLTFYDPKPSGEIDSDSSKEMPPN